MPGARAPAPIDVPAQARFVLGMSACLTLFLYLIPFGDTLAYPLVLLSTLVHELGHGIAAMVIGCEFQQFEMWADGSGVARWLPDADTGPAGFAFVSAGGLCGPAVAAAVGLILGRKPKRAKISLIVFGVVLLLAEIVVVRNGFAWVFVGGVAGAVLIIALTMSHAASQLAVVFLSVQLGLSVYSDRGYLFSKQAETGAGVGPSDVAQMAAALPGPYWLWGAVCAVFSVAMLAFGAYFFLRRNK